MKNIFVMPDVQVLNEFEPRMTKRDLTMDIDDLIIGNRTFRRFYQNEPVSTETLVELINLGRLSASSGNLQPLKYFISNKEPQNSAIFKLLGWGYKKTWMEPGEEPPAYIFILGDTNVTNRFSCDHGISAQSILLGARARGLGGCMIGAMRRDKLHELFQIQAHFVILLVIAIGKPKHDVVIKEISEGESIRYWRDDKKTHYIPKKKLSDVMVDFEFNPIEDESYPPKHD